MRFSSKVLCDGDVIVVGKSLHEQYPPKTVLGFASSNVRINNDFKKLKSGFVPKSDINFKTFGAFSSEASTQEISV